MTAQRPESTRPAATILIVDDEPHITCVMRRKLEKAGYHVLSTNRSREALELTKQHQPDLLLTDFQMPGLSGIELAHALFQLKECRDIPIFLVTARGHRVDEDLLKSTNIREIIAKPFSPQSIQQKISNILSGVHPGTQQPRSQAA